MKKLIFVLGFLFLIILGVFVIALEKTTLEIEKGWNLVAYGAFNKAGSGAQSKIEYGYVYDIYDKEYVLIWKDGDYTDEAKTKYNFQRGEQHWLLSSSMWIYSEQGASMDIWYGEGESMDMFNLKDGWNFIFTIIGLQGKSINEIKGDCDVSKAYVWDAGRQDWEVLTLDQVEFYLGPLDNIAVGFLIKVEDDCKLGLDVASPPALP